MMGRPGKGEGTIEAQRLFKTGAALVAVLAAYQIALGFYFALLRPPLLPEDVRFAATTASRLAAAAPTLAAWLAWVFTVVGGQMGAVGLLLAVLVPRLWRGRVPEFLEIVAFAAAGLASVALMSAVNFTIGSDFRWLLLVPVLIWILALAAMVRLRSV